MPSELIARGHQYRLPVFCPDATRGVVRSLDSSDLDTLEIGGIIVNTWHLHDLVGIERLQTLGGIKKLMNYRHLVISDSGGFQVHSLFQKIPGFGKITDEGLITYTGVKRQHKIIFRPEDSLEMQFAIGSDIMICLDDYTPPDASPQRIKESVKRTIAWAARSRVKFDQCCEKYGYSNDNRPLLFGVIQGGGDLAARRYCAEALLAIGFDGYGLGGQQLVAGRPDFAWTATNAALTPDDFPRYALGFGKPDDIVTLYQQGYQIFDCVLPTRDARHGRFYVHPEPDSREVYQYLNITKACFASDERPLDRHCDCHTCRHYSRSYLHHLQKIGDTTFFRLATIHNLRFYQQLLANLAQLPSPKA